MRFSRLDTDQDIFLKCPRAGCEQVVQGRAGARCPLHGVHLVTPDLAAVHPLLDRYQPIRRVAEGGFATIHLAIDLRAHPHERWVAVKRLNEEHRTPERRSSQLRFKSEGELLADFAELPGVVELIESPLVGNEKLLVLEFIDGLNLSQCISRLGGHLEHDKASRVILSLLVVLSRIHQHGVIHRDIKPANIMITELGETPGEPTRICLLDFGIAKRVHGPVRETVALTQQGMLLGTMCYMAPEQRAGKVADHRSDVYSVGATFFHMLAGYPPFQGTAIEIAHLPQDAKPLSLPPDRFIPPQILEVLHRAMAPEPKDRYASADEMLHDLANAIAEPLPTLQGAAPDRHLSTAYVANPITADDPSSAVRSVIGGGPKEPATIMTQDVFVTEDEDVPEDEPVPPVIEPRSEPPAHRVIIPDGHGLRVALSALGAFVLATVGATFASGGPETSPQALQSTSSPPAMIEALPRAKPDEAPPQWIDYEILAGVPLDAPKTDKVTRSGDGSSPVVTSPRGRSRVRSRTRAKPEKPDKPEKTKTPTPPPRRKPLPP